MGATLCQSAAAHRRPARRAVARVTVRVPRPADSLALAALFAGALAIGSSGIFVRLSETGPTATAFWRGALALPFLAAWAWMERRARTGSAAVAGSAPPASAAPWRDRRFIWAGLLFAGDLALWHWALLLTSIAAATLEANLAPVFVTLIAWIAWRERPRPAFLAALALALAGVVLIVSPKLGAGRGALLGDVLGVGTAVFYAGYIVVVARLRNTCGTGVVMLNSTVVFTVALLPLALTQKFVPDTAEGWALLAGLALIAQSLGQGLIAYALAHLPATFGAVGLYIQPLAAACYAWLLLGERLTAAQLLGAVVVFLAIGLARRSQAAPRAASSVTPAV